MKKRVYHWKKLFGTNHKKSIILKVCDLEPHQIKILFSTYDHLFVVPHKQFGKAFRFNADSESKEFIEIPEEAYFSTYSGNNILSFFNIINQLILNSYISVKKEM
jgi:hypothetical protein